MAALARTRRADTCFHEVYVAGSRIDAMQKLKILGGVLAIIAGVYLLVPEQIEALYNPEVRGIGPAASAQVEAINRQLSENVNVEQAYAIRSDVHQNAGLVAGRLQGPRFEGQLGVWVLVGSARGPTVVRSANRAARAATPDVRHETVRSERLERLVRYVQRR